jgi:hypothetical protein
MDYEAIRHMLLSAGWKDKQIAQAFAEGQLQVPIPAAKQQGGAREAFYPARVMFKTLALLLVVGSAFAYLWMHDRIADRVSKRLRVSASP